MLQDIPPPSSLREACPCVLETERLTLRSPTLADVKAIARLANDRRIAENTRRLPHPYLQEHAVEFVRSIAENRNELVFLIEQNFVPIGMTGLPRKRFDPPTRTSRHGATILDVLGTKGEGHVRRRARVDV